MSELRLIIVAVLIVMLVVETAGCYDTDLRSCVIACGPHDQCPRAFVCQAGLCASSEEICRASSDGGNTDSSDGGHSYADAQSEADAMKFLDAPSIAEVARDTDARTDADSDAQASGMAPDSSVDSVDVEVLVPPPDGWWAKQPGTRANSTSTHGPAAYARSDGTTAIVFGDADNQIHELRFDGDKWRSGNLSSAGVPEAVGPISVFVEGDGTNTVIYRTPSDGVEILTQEFGSNEWRTGDVCGGSTEATEPTIDGPGPGANPLPPVAGAPQGYVRADQTSAIVFRDGGGAVYELARRESTSCWSLSNLASAEGSHLAAGDPMGFVRADRTSSVIYLSADGHIQELSLMFGVSSWELNDLMNSFSVAETPPTAVGQPRGYVRNDGTTAVVYRDDGGRVLELSRIYGTPATSTSWSFGELTTIDGAPLAVSDPAPYIRSDGQSTIVYRAADDLIWELGMPAGTPYWSPANYLSIPGTPAAVEGPIGYVRGDGTTAVVFHDAQGHVWELELIGTPLDWSVGDLTAQSLAP
jgi:hypothetical protein